MRTLLLGCAEFNWDNWKYIEALTRNKEHTIFMTMIKIIVMTMIKNIFMTMIKNIIIIISIIAMNIIFSISSFEIELSFIYLSTTIRHHYDYHDHMMI